METLFETQATPNANPATPANANALSANFEDKIKDLLAKKIEDQDLEFLKGFYEIPGLYRYSLNNSLLIAIQGGSIALGFDRWKQLDRYVKRGEKARIEILVPIIKRCTASATIAACTARADSQAHILNRSELPSDRERCVGFISKKVFDITQTDGKPLEYKHNSTEALNVDFDSLSGKLSAGLKIEIKRELTGNARGYFDRMSKTIAVSSMANNSDAIKTLIHELGHYLLHNDPDAVKSHPAREVEAELVSILVCGVLGVEFRESEAYVAFYNQHKPQVRIMKVISAAQKILTPLMSA